MGWPAIALGGAGVPGDQRDWLVVERLPAYVPELNPVEGLWSNLKGNELANVAAGGLGGAMAAAWRGIERVRAAWWLPYSFPPTARNCLRRFINRSTTLRCR